MRFVAMKFAYSSAVMLCAAALALTLTYDDAIAEDVGQRIIDSGTLNAGVLKDLKPFGYIDANGNHVGYGVDLINVVKSRIEKTTDTEISINFVEINAQNRFDAVTSGKVDIVCGATTYTWEREQIVDFTVSVFPGGTQFLIPRERDLREPSDLNGLRLGVERGTLAESIGELIGAEPEIVPTDTIVQAFEMLKSGDLDLIADDGVVLSAMRSDADDSDQWLIVPDEPVTHEAYACMVPENDSQWRDFVNYSLIRALNGYLLDDPEFIEMYDGWFGQNGVSPYSEEALKEHFNGVVNSVARIPKSLY